MIKVIEQTPTRLVLRSRRPVMAGTVLVFMALSFLALINLVLQSARRLSLLDPFQLLAVLLWLSLALAMLGFAWLAWQSLGRGRWCIFDLSTQELTLISPLGWRRQTRHIPLPALKRVDIEHNAEVRVYAAFLVLQNGERLAIASFSPFEEADARTLAKQIGQFVRG
jgi:hypothetical protein